MRRNRSDVEAGVLQRRTAMALKVELKPNERIIIGSCVVTNTDQRARLLIDGDRVPILREKDILTPETADTPAKLVYLSVQLMYLSPDPMAHHPTYFSLVRDILSTMPSAWPFIEGINNQIPLYTVFTADETTPPALREAAIGQYKARFWSPDIKIPASQKYVADFRKKFGYTPSFYGAQSYDSIMLIDSAVRATQGNLKDTQALVKAMRKADFDSIRGKFTYNVNHHPIQDFYLLQAVKSSGPDGAEMRILQKAFEKHKDAYSQDCKMKW